MRAWDQPLRWWWVATLGAGVAAATLVWRGGGAQPDFAEILIPAEDTSLAAPPPGSGDRLRVLTWNIHYGSGAQGPSGRLRSRAAVEANLAAMGQAIERWQPDVVALQEVDRHAWRSHFIDQLEALRQASGLAFAAWTPTWDAGWVPWPGLHPRGQIGRVQSGQAVLSRYPIREADRHALPQAPSGGALVRRFSLHRALLVVAIELRAGRVLTVVNAHLEAFDRRTRQAHADRVAAVLERAGPDVLLLGDLNAVPPEASVQAGWIDEPTIDPRPDQTIARLASLDGIQPAISPEAYRDDEAHWFTYPASAPSRSLDYVFYGPGLEVRHVEVPRVQVAGQPASDHLPVLATLQLR